MAAGPCDSHPAPSSRGPRCCTMPEACVLRGTEGFSGCQWEGVACSLQDMFRHPTDISTHLLCSRTILGTGDTERGETYFSGKSIVRLSNSTYQLSQLTGPSLLLDGESATEEKQ